jgi:Raf kinase inhibitor-like YbhB/YbcL family protein
MKKIFLTLLSILSLFLFSNYGISSDGFKISSPAFENNAFIPEKFTCVGKDVNPPLMIEKIPQGTKSIALIVDDVDAPRGIWVHWVLWNIPQGTKEIKENSVPEGAKQGLNDFRKRQYNGPCPPPGIHRYYFKIYALDVVLNLEPDTTKTDLEKAMKGHIIGQSYIIGLFKRR